MKNKSFFYGFAFACLAIVFLSPESKAQNRNASAQELTQTEQPQRPNLLKELDLTPDQVRRIRQINQERKEERQAANRRLKAANDALDAAIYGDADDDVQVQQRMREVHAARLEVLKNRVASEQKIRRVLTPQQLLKFRDLKSEYAQTKVPNEKSGNNLNINQNRKSPPQQQRLERIQNRRQRRVNR